jgi:radical SAM/Cys-rich protein
MALPTLLNSQSPLASTAMQRATLDELSLAMSFGQAASRAGHAPLRARAVDVLQVNVGKRCTEVMPDAVVEACLAFIERCDVGTVDITGGAPELHPRFREIVTRARASGRRVIDRCNLTITQLPNYADLPAFLAEHRVDVVASLPSFAARQTDAQRGQGVFDQSIAALRQFNALGYGIEGSGLLLDLVTNPVGAFLPAGQAALERDWKRELARRFGISFNRLYTITNMPISRYLEFLVASGNLQGYMDKLVAAFNPATVDGLMCRTTLSVGWDGRLFDCDFNQMIELGVETSAPQTIFDATVEALAGRPIAIGRHCFGCTAGAGSSCGGSIAPPS